MELRGPFGGLGLPRVKIYVTQSKKLDSEDIEVSEHARGKPRSPKGPRKSSFFKKSK